MDQPTAVPPPTHSSLKRPSPADSQMEDVGEKIADTEAGSVNASSEGEVVKIAAAGDDPFGDEEGAGIKYKTMTWQ